MESYINDYEKYFKEVYERNIDMIYRICFIYLRGNKSNAEDAIQTTFLNMFKKEIIFKNKEHEKAWLITVSTNVCKNLLKSKWNKHISIDELNIPYSENKNKDILQEVLKLPDKYKQVVYMHYYEGYSCVEIAKMLNTKENTIYSHLNKARAILKKNLKENFYE